MITQCTSHELPHDEIPAVNESIIDSRSDFGDPGATSVIELFQSKFGFPVTDQPFENRSVG